MLRLQSKVVRTSEYTRDDKGEIIKTTETTEEFMEDFEDHAKVPKLYENTSSTL